jgi:hypothetical protein
MSRAAVFLAVVLTSTTALANEAPAYPPPPPLPQQPAPPPPYYPAQVPYTPGPTYAYAPPPQAYPTPDAEGPKNAWTAGMLSLGATLGPPLLATIAMGNRNESEREEVVAKVALTSVMIGPSVGHVYAGKFLTAGLAVRTLGFAVAMSATSTDDLGDALGRILLGSIAIMSGAIADLATVGKSVREYNAEHMRLVPTVAPIVGQHGDRGVQVGMSGSF